ncbi:MAG: metallophosphoesterase family protein [Planctomycetota bacterium]
MAGAELSIGLFADPHCGRGVLASRYFGDSPAKLAAAVETFNERGVDFIVNLGDLIDRLEDDPTDPRQYVAEARAVVEGFDGPCHVVPGNHDVACLTKSDFLRLAGGAGGASTYAFDHGGFHFVVLDTNHFEDGSDITPETTSEDWSDEWLGQTQLDWLADDLAAAGETPTVIFTHAELGPRFLDDEERPHAVKDSDVARAIIQSAGNVRAIFQGHNHPGQIAYWADIPYITLHAMCEGPGLANNAYAILHLSPDGPIQLEGFGQQVSFEPRVVD